MAQKNIKMAAMENLVFVYFVSYLLMKCDIRETVPSQTSDMGRKTVSVLAHSVLLP